MNISNSYEIHISGDNRNYEISKNELIEFLQNYGDSYSITDEKKKNRSQIELVSNEGISLTIDKETREELIETGYDFSSVFKNQETHNVEISKEEPIQETTTQGQMAMIKYKESFIKKWVKRAKETYRGIKEKIFNRGDRNDTFEIQSINVSNPQKKKLPSWDLGNWTKEELEEAKNAVGKRTQNTQEIQNDMDKSIDD